jgi:hypothetical protein
MVERFPSRVLCGADRFSRRVGCEPCELVQHDKIDARQRATQAIPAVDVLQVIVLHLYTSTNCRIPAQSRRRPWRSLLAHA